jgi:hypothetical protein
MDKQELTRIAQKYLRVFRGQHHETPQLCHTVSESLKIDTVAFHIFTTQIQAVVATGNVVEL